MPFVLKVLAVVLFTIAIMFFIKKLVESVINLSYLSKDKNLYDVSNQKHGVVLNKKTKKLEADQSVILPFS
jgi:hypothetical protein